MYAIMKRLSCRARRNKMNVNNTIELIRSHLISTLQDIDKWFDEPEYLRTYKPVEGGWSINEILEHIHLASHYLLILIEKGKIKALKNVQKRDLKTEIAKHKFGSVKLDEIGISQRFNWFRPDHMAPTGQVNFAVTRKGLHEQLKLCLDCLALLKNGEGLLYLTTMSVNNLGKINVYDYIYFLSKHAERHNQQMRRVQKEYENPTLDKTLRKL